VLLILLVGAFIYSYLTLSSSYILLPDHPHALAPLVDMQGGHATGAGGIYFVDVVERRATLAERYLSFLNPDGTIVSEQSLAPDNLNEQQRTRLDRAAMARSKTIAEAVALRSLGYHVVTHPQGTLVEQTAPGSPAAGKLLPGDLIVAADGQPTLVASRLRRLIERHRVGQLVRLTLLRNGHKRKLALRTYSLPSEPHVPLIGILVTQAATVKLPIKVEINAGNVIGPSAGLAFALELADRLGRNVDRGYRVAATGELALDGTVLPIGGVKQKVIGARRAGIQIMLLPAGDNAAEARHYAGHMKIIGVASFQQALRNLATLPVQR
jgi:PDZ domain-containing protein